MGIAHDTGTLYIESLWTYCSIGSRNLLNRPVKNQLSSSEDTIEDVTHSEVSFLLLVSFDFFLKFKLNLVEEFSWIKVCSFCTETFKIQSDKVVHL